MPEEEALKTLENKYCLPQELQDEFASQGKTLARILCAANVPQLEYYNVKTIFADENFADSVGQIFSDFLDEDIAEIAQEVFNELEYASSVTLCSNSLKSPKSRKSLQSHD